MKTHSLHDRFSRNERGQTMLEFAIGLPMLILLIIGAVDIARGLNSYQAIVQVVREGVRYGGTIPGLREGSFNNLPSTSGCGDNPPGCKTHKQIQTRVRDLFRQDVVQKNIQLDPEQVAITTRFSPSDNTSADIDDEVMVEVSVPFHAMFPLFNNIPIRVSASGPYLFRKTT